MNKLTRPRTAEQLLSSSKPFQQKWGQFLDVLTKVRSGMSLNKASKETGLSSRTVIRLAGSTATKGANGRYSVKTTDNLLRILKVPTADGIHEIGVRGTRHASQLGTYWAGLNKYLTTGDSIALDKFNGKTVKDDSGNLIPLLTDHATLKRLGSAGVLSFESLYARSN
jgi:hypothetical protein